MDTKGRMLKCDRCGKSIFTVYLGEVTSDGGFSRWDRFEKPEGWDSTDWTYTGKSYDLCPTCMDMYRALRDRHKRDMKALIKEVADGHQTD